MPALAEKSDLLIIRPSDISRVLKLMSKSKAVGADGWSPGELAMLHTKFIQGLADIYNEAERQGRWPRDIMHAIVAMIRKVLDHRLRRGG